MPDACWVDIRDHQEVISNIGAAAILQRGTQREGLYVKMSEYLRISILISRQFQAAMYLGPGATAVNSAPAFLAAAELARRDGDRVRPSEDGLTLLQQKEPCGDGSTSTVGWFRVYDWNSYGLLLSEEGRRIGSPGPYEMVRRFWYTYSSVLKIQRCPGGIVDCCNGLMRQPFLGEGGHRLRSPGPCEMVRRFSGSAITSSSDVRIALVSMTDGRVVEGTVHVNVSKLQEGILQQKAAVPMTTTSLNVEAQLILWSVQSSHHLQHNGDDESRQGDSNGLAERAAVSTCYGSLSAVPSPLKEKGNGRALTKVVVRETTQRSSQWQREKDYMEEAVKEFEYIHRIFTETRSGKFREFQEELIPSRQNAARPWLVREFLGGTCCLDAYQAVYVHAADAAAVTGWELSKGAPGTVRASDIKRLLKLLNPFVGRLLHARHALFILSSTFKLLAHVPHKDPRSSLSSLSGGFRTPGLSRSFFIWPRGVGGTFPDSVLCGSETTSRFFESLALESVEAVGWLQQKIWVFLE
ncbi:hypothetical protein JOM56_007504 [Amanita muscaria]